MKQQWKVKVVALAGETVLEEGWEPVGVFHHGTGPIQAPVVLLRADARPADLDLVKTREGHPLSVRTRNVLDRLNITSSVELMELRETQLRKVRNCGDKTVREILDTAACLRKTRPVHRRMTYPKCLQSRIRELEKEVRP